MKKKQNPKPLYSVMFHGAEMEVFYSISDALRAIGTAAKGRRFGWGRVTTAEAVNQGFSIQQYKEAL